MNRTLVILLVALLFAGAIPARPGNSVEVRHRSEMARRRHKRHLSRAQSSHPSGMNSLTSMRRLTLPSPLTNAYFGRSVANAGDVNGDGYDDVIVGAFQIGKAYIYFGGPAMDTIPDVILSGPHFFGHVVSSAGDVNGDGYDDVIVSDGGVSNAFIFFGGAAMDSIPDVVLNVPAYSVSAAGDVNGDGYDDVIVGLAGTQIGGAQIYFGGPSMDNTPDVVIQVPTLAFFGTSVSSAGDINGDGYPDVIVGSGDAPNGRAYIFFGGATMDGIADVILSGHNGDTGFGQSVSRAGDVNGDGYDDVIIGAGNPYTPGHAYIYFGGSPMDTLADVTMTDSVTSHDFGESVSYAGDVNGDGYDDVIVGADGGPYDAGHAFIYFGGTSIDTTADVILTGETGLAFGSWVNSAGDVDGDGLADLVVGAVDEYWSPHSGSAYVYISSTPLPIQLASFSGTVLPGDHVRLDWTTLSETDNYGFEVQRKRAQEADFTMVPGSFVPGHGTTNEPHSYSFIDSTVAPGEWRYRLKILDLDSSFRYTDPISVSLLTGVSEQDIPVEFSLQQNYPNPFNPTTVINYALPRNSRVTLTVFDLLGRQVEQLVDQQQVAGYHGVTFHADGLAGGMYFYRLQTDNFTAVKKLILMR